MKPKKVDIKWELIGYGQKNKSEQCKQFIVKTANIYEKDPKTKSALKVSFRDQKDFLKEKFYWFECEGRYECQRKKAHTFHQVYIFDISGKKFFF